MGLTQQEINSLFDAFELYRNHLRQVLEPEKADAAIRKLKTGLVRFTLPGWGYPLKLTGRLTPEEMIRGIEFMASVSSLQANQALEIQDSVFERMGEQVPAASKRVYRSAIRQFLEFCQSLTTWPTYRRKGLPPAAYIYGERGQVGPRFGLRLEDVPTKLQAELDDYSQAFATRTPPLKRTSVERQLKSIRTLMGWLYSVKAVPLAELSLFKVVPIEALFDETVADTVVALAQDYIDWLKTRQDTLRTQKSVVLLLLYLTEYVHYVHVNRSDSPLEVTTGPSPCTVGPKINCVSP